MAAVVLVDSGGANIGSVRYALQRLGVDAPVTHDAARIRSASHVILPGVGTAAAGMARLRETGLIDILRGLRQPLLGICLGMQLLYERSDEGAAQCLGLLGGSVRRLRPRADVRVPHMGWNRLRVVRDDPLLEGVGPGEHVYFVHGYAPAVDSATLADCDHGGAFAAVVRRGNVCGMQFHPERSGSVGARLLANFLES
ncbi:MAG: imidazole glycerol phosphate synthase subunit HisH [Xanthomonadaceae bacterium]|nr:imidazole glycerol phosphate synthase subunit HisH [Xanthomonadaceae bacterium]MDE2085084.1 imidazole glycerol phosphate synthase subunit HisH [Xanthomonadaceae bacterium]MDE2256259.1 imidazole glycerol phosphate synthase subunit HisH [Xanthomonadaceae bacterium]